MKKFIVALGFALSLFAVPAWAQSFNACGQTFSYPGPSKVIVNMTVNLTCPANTIGVTLGTFVTLQMNGHILTSTNVGVTTGAGVQFTGKPNDLKGPGTISGFYRNVRVLANVGETNVNSINGITATAARYTSIAIGSNSNTSVTNNVIRLSQTSSGVVCNGKCVVTGNTINGHAVDGLRCTNTTSCSSYSNAFSSNTSQDIEVNNSNMFVEFRSCPHDINAILGSTVNLDELSSCSIDCLNDGTSTYTGTTGVCN